MHPCGATELLIDALPEGTKREGALFPDGAHLTDLPAVRDLLYTMQRPAIAPSVRSRLVSPYPADMSIQLVYPHDWSVFWTTPGVEYALTM